MANNVRMTKISDKMDTCNLYQANPLIEACRDMTINEGRLFYLALMLVRPQLKEGIGDMEFNEVVIPAADVIRVFGNDSYYAKLKKISLGLQKKIMFVQHPDGKLERINIFSKMVFDPKEYDGLAIKFNGDMRPYILELWNKSYTKIAAKTLLSLTSSYSPRLLELLLERQNLPKFRKSGIIERTITIDELRRYCAIAEDQYQNVTMFTKKIVAKSVEDICQSTEYIVEYTANKENNKVQSYTFRMKMPRKNIGKNTDGDDFADGGDLSILDLAENARNGRAMKAISNIDMNDKHASVVETLIKCGVGPIAAKRLANEYPESRIFENIEYAFSRKNVKNTGAYVVKAIRENFAENKKISDRWAEEKLFARANEIMTEQKIYETKKVRYAKAVQRLAQLIRDNDLDVAEYAVDPTAAAIVSAIMERKNRFASMDYILESLNMSAVDIDEYVSRGKETNLFAEEEEEDDDFEEDFEPEDEDVENEEISKELVYKSILKEISKNKKLGMDYLEKAAEYDINIANICKILGVSIEDIV